jgi:dTDP-4-amino-4,6-dideoxygalactose transaminase
MNMDIALVEEAVGPLTKAIMPVHLYGQPTPCSPLLKLAQESGAVLLEDAAQAHGARYGNAMVGSLAHGAGFSFYPGKNLGAFGDAGAIVTNSLEIADRVRELANYGSSEKYVHNVRGINSRLDPLQAAFLSTKLKRIAEWNQRRRDIAAVYLKVLGDCEGLILPSVADDVDPVWHLYVVRHANRDALQTELLRRGVPTALHYPIPNHQSGAFKEVFRNAKYPVAEEICRTCLSLPIGPHLTTDDASRIAEIVCSAARDLA